MRSLALCIVVALSSGACLAGERVAGTNAYFLNEQRWHTGKGTGFWMQNNFGTFEVTEGPLDPGPVECHGSGFWTEFGAKATGSGICIYGSGLNTHTWRYTVNPGRAAEWEIIEATGKYAGMTGSGKSATREDDEGIKIRIRVTDWTGEVEFPK
jgi:hypothetical protein